MADYDTNNVRPEIFDPQASRPLRAEEWQHACHCVNLHDELVKALKQFEQRGSKHHLEWTDADWRAEGVARKLLARAKGATT